MADPKGIPPGAVEAQVAHGKFSRPIRTNLGARTPTRHLGPGSVVRFTYRHHTGASPAEPKEDHKEVLLLHPHFEGKMHGIDMRRLTEAERQVLYAVFDPNVIAGVRNGTNRHRLPLVNDICKRMDPLEECKNPLNFYQKFVKVFITGKDVYRTYYPRRMWNVTVVHKSAAEKVQDPMPGLRNISNKADRDVAQAAAEKQIGVPDESQFQRALKNKALTKGIVKPSPKSADKERRLANIKARVQAPKGPAKPK